MSVLKTIQRLALKTRERTYVLLYDESGVPRYIAPARLVKQTQTSVGGAITQVATYVVNLPDRVVVVLVRDESAYNAYIDLQDQNGRYKGSVKLIQAFLLNQNVAHAIETQIDVEVAKAIDALAQGVQITTAEQRLALAKIISMAERVIADMPTALSIASEFKRLSRAGFDKRLLLLMLMGIVALAILGAVFG
ncbi:MAG: hypothetical protein QW794_07205 [Thermosphaera sp.]